MPIGNYDPRYLAMYGKQPPMGMAGSVPPAPMPQLRESSPLELQRINQAGNIGQQFSPVMQPTPQSSVNAMFQPPVGDMQKQIGGITQGNVVQPPSPEQADVVASEMAKMRQEPQNKSGFDLKGLAKDLFGGKKNTAAAGMITDLTPHSGAGVIMPKSAPQPIGMQANQGQGQPSTQAAMSAITGGIGSTPQLEQMLKALRYVR